MFISLAIKGTDKVVYVKNQYNIVVIDTIPILVATDSAIIDKYLGTSSLIAFYGANKVKDLDLSLKCFK